MCAEFHMSCQVTGSEFEVGPEFRLQTLLEIGMVDKKEVGTVPKPFMQCPGKPILALNTTIGLRGFVSFREDQYVVLLRQIVVKP